MFNNAMNWINRLTGLITTAEGQFTAPQSGQQKKGWVITEFLSGAQGVDLPPFLADTAKLGAVVDFLVFLGNIVADGKINFAELLGLVTQTGALWNALKG